MGSAWQQGGSEGRGLGLGAQQAPWCLSGQGKSWPHSLLFLRTTPHRLPQSLPHPCWTPNCGWVPLGVETPSLPQPHLRGSSLRGLAFTFAPPSLPSIPSGPTWLEGGLGGQRIRTGISAGFRGPTWVGETRPCSLLILCPPNGSPISPFRHGIPSPPPTTPQGRQSCLPSTSPPPSLPPLPMSYPVAGGFSHSIRCLRSPTSAW